MDTLLAGARVRVRVRVRRSRGDTRRTPEQKRADEARRAAETAKRQANFDAASHAHHDTYS